MVTGSGTATIIPQFTGANTVGDSIAFQKDVYSLAILAQQGDNLGAALELHKRGTTGNTNAAVVSGAVLGDLRWRGWNGTSQSATAVGISGVATEGFAVGANGGKLVFETTPNGTTVRQTRMQIDQDGTVTIPGDAKANNITSTNTVTASGIATTSTSAAVTISSTGWTNSFANNATIFLEFTNATWTVYSGAGTAVFTNTFTVGPAITSVPLQLSGKVIVTSGVVAGRAVPW